jgi:hypothetical protein
MNEDIDQTSEAVFEALHAIVTAAKAIGERVELFGPDVEPLVKITLTAVYLKEEERRLRQAELLERSLDLDTNK